MTVYLCTCHVLINVCLFCRFAIAKRMLGQPNHALDLIEKALKRDPNNKSIKLEKQSVSVIQC